MPEVFERVNVMRDGKRVNVPSHGICKSCDP